MRIWVTGVGVVSPLGCGSRETMDALLAGKRAFGALTLFDAAGCRSQIAAEVAGLKVEDVAPSGEGEGWSRTDAMAVLAAREALAQAGLELPRESVDLVLAGTTAGMYETEDLLAQMNSDPEARRPLQRMLSHPLSATVERLQSVTGPYRQARTLCSACSGGSNAILMAASWLQAGLSERVLAGGADGLCRLTYTGFSCLGALSPEPCRPFDSERSGLNLGEGAAFLMLETEAAGRARGAVPLAELRGWAAASEAHHITHPEPSGQTASRVMMRALERAGIAPSEVDYVNAHGTATTFNDAMEAKALQRCFGASDGPAVSSSKGQIGHTLGAAGALEAAISVMAISRGVVPPTMGLQEVDPACVLDHVRKARAGRIRSAMSNSFGFGGSDAVVVFSGADIFEPLLPLSARPVVVSAAATVGPLGVTATDGAKRYLAQESGPGSSDGSFDVAQYLDLDRARRIDRAGRMAAVAIGQAFDAAGLTAQADDDWRLQAGAITGAAFGAVDACSAFVRRILDKGARFASPAVFPNLLPSSPVAHASIYHRLGGVAFSGADLGATAESAMVSAIELVAAGESPMMVAGGTEEASAITEAVLGPLCSGLVAGADIVAGAGGAAGVGRAEGAAMLLFEDRDALRLRGGRAVAQVTGYTSWRGEVGERLAELPAPRGRALIAVAHDDVSFSAFLRASAWHDVPRAAAAQRAGNHEAAGGFAAAAVVSMLAAGQLDSALVLGLAPDRGYAFSLVAEGPEA